MPFLIYFVKILLKIETILLLIPAILYASTVATKMILFWTIIVFSRDIFVVFALSSLRVCVLEDKNPKMSSLLRCVRLICHKMAYLFMSHVILVIQLSLISHDSSIANNIVKVILIPQTCGSVTFEDFFKILICTVFANIFFFFRDRFFIFKGVKKTLRKALS